MTGTEKMTYAGTGVSYADMDPFKIAAQKAAKETSIKHFGPNQFRIADWSRGESAFLIEAPFEDMYIAHTEEGLGTKNLVADAMYRISGKSRYEQHAQDVIFFDSFYDKVAQDTVAMIVNDVITLGAMPISVAMHVAAGDSSWFNDTHRAQQLVEGWRNACDKAGCVWSGGETPTLRGIVEPETVLLSGSAVGIVKPRRNVIRDKIADGDAIVIVQSSGIHANGLTAARKIAEKLPEGYLTKLPNGRTYGEVLLDPTPIYVPVVFDCIQSGIDIHYAVNVTGHGWRKFMRAAGSFAYVIKQLPDQLPIFDFLQKYGPIDDEEAYGNFNMGAGFALYVPPDQAEMTVDVIHDLNADNHDFTAFIAGHIEKSDQKKVVIKPKGLEFRGETLAIR